MTRHHLAVALVLRGRERIEVDALRTALGDPDLERIPAHVTLVPPVNVRADDVDPVLAILRDAASGLDPITLELGPPATFLPTNPTLHLAVGGGTEAVSMLRESLQVGPFDRPASYQFVPHVTLLNPASPDVIERARETLAAFRVTALVDRVDLLEERDGVWVPIADAAFGASRLPVGRGSLPLELAESRQLDPAAAAFARREWQHHDRATFGPGTRWEQDPFAISARRDTTVVGIATGWTGLGIGFLSELMVAAGTRGEGVGSHLLAGVERLARRAACRRLALRTDAGSRAQAFYEARGWTVEATFREWLAGRDFVQLGRELR